MYNSFDRQFRRTGLMTKFIFISVFSLIVLGISLNIVNELHTEIIPDVTVESLQQQQLITGSKNNVSTQIRYLIITDKGTFICESSLINNKWDNSNIFWHLKEGKKYTFFVSGYGKSAFFDYQNVLQVVNR